MKPTRIPAVGEIWLQENQKVQIANLVLVTRMYESFGTGIPGMKICSWRGEEGILARDYVELNWTCEQGWDWTLISAAGDDR